MTCVARFPSSGIPLAGQGHRKGRALPDGAVHRNGSPMALDDFRDNVEPHAQAGNGFLLGTSDPIEALKDLVALLSRDAQAMIADTDGDRLRRGAQVYLDGFGVRRVLDGVPEQIGEDLSDAGRV